MDNFDTLLIERTNAAWILTFHRPKQRNSINETLLKEIHYLMDQAEKDSSCRFIIFQGKNGIFCTGMDFQAITCSEQANISGDNFSNQYMLLLKRFTTTAKIVISLVDGQVLAGGIGIAAASDLVLSTARAQFGLSEALWGLLPACVLPFLIRRIGFQKAYAMTLTTQTIDAKEAQAINLVDELGENLEESLRRLQLRLSRIQEDTIKDLKAYFRKLWIINETIEATAVAEITRLIGKPQIRNNIKNFIEHQQFPWEKNEKESI